MKAPPKEADERLLIAAAQADPSRFADLYDLHFERVYAFVARRVPVRAEAEDATSEVFHRALENIARFEWRGVPFAAWLFRIAANAIAARWQRAAREGGNPGHTVEEIPAREYLSLEEIERRAMVFRLVSALPAAQRRVVTMRFTEGRSVREIAQALRRTEGAVKQLQFRALETLRAKLGGKNG